MSDQDIILQAYADTVRHLFAVLFESTTLAKNAPQRTAAENAFRTGIQLARAIRDRAVALAAGN